MKKILIVGNAPLPLEKSKSRPAAGLRTYQFLKPLMDSANFELKLVTIAMPECYDLEPEKKIIKETGYEQLLISKNEPSLIKEIQNFTDDFRPEAIIGVNTFPSYVASKLKTDIPMWMDLNGWIMAEAQAQAYKLESNGYLSHYFSMEQTILKRADKVSVVSGNQKYAILGELASLGRLNKETFGYDFCLHIANGTQDFGEVEKPGQTFNSYDGKFVALWLGGYNTWADEATLFRGLEKAMEACDKLVFVSTGGEIKGLNNKTFANFKSMVERSKFRERFNFLGWVDTQDLAGLYKIAVVGLNVDRTCVETLTGARNRINEMMKFGLPVITSLGSEISYEVEKSGSGIGFKSGNAEAFSDALRKMYKEWDGSALTENYKLYSENAENYINVNCNYKTLMQPLLEWLGNPQRAADRDIYVKIDGKISIAAIYRYLKENGLRKSFKKFLQKI